MYTFTCTLCIHVHNTLYFYGTYTHDVSMLYSWPSIIWKRKLKSRYNFNKNPYIPLFTPPLPFSLPPSLSPSFPSVSPSLPPPRLFCVKERQLQVQTLARESILSELGGVEGKYQAIMSQVTSTSEQMAQLEANGG